jgi:beta-galactosidase
MPDRFAPISAKCPHVLHGGDYNPDQWLHSPQVFDEDMRLMKLAGCNAMTVGVFSWTALEKADGQYDFTWLDETMDRLAAHGVFAVLATPSGAKPAWMSEKYPEVRRVKADGQREVHWFRHNHCRTSPVYRRKSQEMNARLAQRYKDHPALLMWHVSNEYNGRDCHCELCYQAFRTWLKNRYHNSLDELNHAWWTTFWSHIYTDWDQIRPVDPTLQGLMLDWQRFGTDQTIDFYRNEIVPLRELTPHVPITTNFMGFSITLDYWKFAPEVDVISWDSYPTYSDRPEGWLSAVNTSLVHDMNRSFKGGKPFMLMECSPSVTSLAAVCRLKRPGLHILEGLQAVAHGSDTVQYFQWRKGRGGNEKFHGAVVDHYPTEHTRIFGEVTELGKILARLDDVVGTTTPAQVAILYDWQNRWAIDLTEGPRKEKKDYAQTCCAHYRPFWSAGISCDVVNEDTADLSRYKLLIAPMLYQVRPGLAERVEAFVRAGGVFGVANESDLCFMNGFPGPLREVTGVWAEEIDALHDDETVDIRALEGNPAGLAGTYKARILCDLLNADTARPLAVYDSEFYRGRPAVTVNTFGKGRAYYIASRNDERFHADFYGRLIADLNLRQALGGKLPDGVTAQIRTDGKREFIFLLGFNRQPVEIPLGDKSYGDVLTGETCAHMLKLPAFTVRILETNGI